MSVTGQCFGMVRKVPKGFVGSEEGKREKARAGETARSTRSTPHRKGGEGWNSKCTSSASEVGGVEALRRYEKINDVTYAAVSAAIWCSFFPCAKARCRSTLGLKDKDYRPINISLSAKLNSQIQSVRLVLPLMQPYSCSHGLFLIWT